LDFRLSSKDGFTKGFLAKAREENSMGKRIASGLAVLASIATVLGLLVALNIIHPFPSPSSPTFSQSPLSSDFTPTPVVTVNSSGSNPTDTLNSYCTALKTDNAQMLYDTFSANGKTKISLSQVQQIMAVDDTQGGISQCTFINVQENGSTATANMSLSYGSGANHTGNAYLVLENGVWKVDSTTSTS
jgi:hypothetical protein